MPKDLSAGSVHQSKHTSSRKYLWGHISWTECHTRGKGRALVVTLAVAVADIFRAGSRKAILVNRLDYTQDNLSYPAGKMRREIGRA
jgi:hypothetical protein